MRSTTLLDFKEGGLPEADDFLSRHRRLPAESFREEVESQFGPVASRDPSLRRRVNEITLRYLDGLRGRDDGRREC